MGGCRHTGLALLVTHFVEHGDRLRGKGHDPIAQLAHRFGAGSVTDISSTSFILTVVTTSIVWLTVMLLTPPEPMPTLEAFYLSLRPYVFLDRSLSVAKRWSLATDSGAIFRTTLWGWVSAPACYLAARSFFSETMVLLRHASR